MKRFNAHEARRKRFKLGCEQLEVRRVLDASAISIWDQMPDVAGQALTVDAGMTAKANAQFGEWTYTSSGSAVTIDGYTGPGGAVEIPAQIEGLPVTAIGDYAFSGKASLTSVMIPVGVRSIGTSAFSTCTGLASISIPTGVTSIGSSAFYYCTGLTSVTIPAGVTSISSRTFYHCDSLANVTIPASVLFIQRYAFNYCSNLMSMYCFGNAPEYGGFTILDLTPATVFRLKTAVGWSSVFDSRPVQILQVVSAAAGQTNHGNVGSTVSRVLKQGVGTVVLDTASTHTGGTVVEAGELVVRDKDALGTGLLEVQAGAKATLQTGYGTVSVTSLSLASTARLELGTSKMTVATGGFTESSIRTKLIAGRNGGSWNGVSGITSTFAGGGRSIGYRVADGALEVAYAAPGDSNLDGVIDILDIGDILSAGKFNTGEPANWQQGDTNYDNVFDIVDLADILGTGLFNQGNYLTQGSASSAAAETGGVATFDSALVFAAFAMDSGSHPTTKRKSL